MKQQGRRHALLGLAYFLWISTGFLNLLRHEEMVNFLLFDVVLGILGILLPLSAAEDFSHKRIKNIASGTLDAHATVTHSEMIEHSFYQAINLVQVLFFHFAPLYSNWSWRLGALMLATSPWLLRSQFPINKFSDNYNKEDERSSTFIRILYRTKKYQYVFYKHFLLHGLNISVAYSGIIMTNRFDFRLYWILLNTSYVMEFFLQTLVKKRYMEQSTMLNLQILLMLASSIAAVFILQHVYIAIAVASLAFNFANRGYDFLNTIVVISLCLLYIHIIH